MTEKDSEADFDVAMLGIYRGAVAIGYNAHWYLEMYGRLGGLQTARQLLSTREDVQTGFTELYLRQRLDLTVEYLVLRAPWRQLFSENELAIAKARLLAHDFPVEKLPAR